MALKAYFDDSGKGNDPNERVIGVGGFIGAVEQLDAFEARWLKVLEAGGLDYLHTVKLEEAFTGRERDLLPFVDSVIGLFRELCFVPIAAVMPVLAFRDLPPEQQDELKDALNACWQVSLESLVLHCAPYPPGELAQVFFADTPKLNGLISDVYHEFALTHLLGNRLGPLTQDVSPKGTEGKTKVLQLQGADFVAYTASKGLKRALDDPPNHWASYAFEALHGFGPSYFEWVPSRRLREGF